MSPNSQIFNRTVEMVTTLREARFFDENPLIDEDLLIKKMITTMQENYANTEEIGITERDFLKIVDEVAGESLESTLISLSEKGALVMSVNEKGELAYGRNPNFEF